MPRLDEILELGIDSLKQEGRNKSLNYLEIVTRAYRLAIDNWYKDPATWDPKQYMEDLHTIPNCGYTLAFHDDRLSDHAHNLESEKSLSKFEFTRIVTNTPGDGLTIHIRNNLESGDVLEFVSPKNPYTFFLRVYSFVDPVSGIEREVVHGGQD